MVDTTNNTADNSEEQENPQSILEKRLAEINASRNEGQAQQVNDKDNDSDSDSALKLMGSAVAAHEAIPPVAAAPAAASELPEPEQASLETNTPAVESPASAADHQKNLSSPNPIQQESAVNRAAGEEVSADRPGTNNEVAAPTTQVPEEVIYSPVSATATENAEAPATTAETSLPAPAAFTEEQTNKPELLSTAGVITDPADTDAEEVVRNNPEAATTTTTTTTTTAPVNTEGPGIGGSNSPADELLLDDDHHEELASETDYSTLSITELRQKLGQTFKNATRQQSREIYELYRLYEAKMAEEKAEALQSFTTEGGTADDFEFKPGPEHQEIEKGFQNFRESRSREQRQDEEQKVKNAKRKQELLDQLRELVESPETKSSGDKIKQIQSEWKNLGPVPAAEAKQLWNSYHALLDIFYNNRSIFNELKDLDRRRNLQHKIQLCERSESLIEQPSINVALQELRNLHEEWKHVGPVPNEQRDPIWERFIQASEKVHARKKEFITARKSVEQDNLVKKSELLFRMEPYQNFQTDRINDWRDKTDEIQKLKEEWDAIGLVPKERADEINKRFWSSYKSFFNHKNAFFKNLDEQKMQNLRLKTELCEQAESLKDSQDWDETKETLIQLQKKWKTIGRVPDKYSDKLWQRFRTACNEFFDRKQNQVTQRENELTQASQVKNNLYEQLASRMTTISTAPGTMAEFDQIREKYLSLPVTKFSGKTDDRFFDLLQKYVGSIADLTNEEKDNIAAALQVTRIKTGPDAGNRIHQKEQAIKRDIAQLENDIRTLKTNIEFFGRSKNAEKLREEYNARIEEADHRIQQLQRQLYLFRNS